MYRIPSVPITCTMNHAGQYVPLRIGEVGDLYAIFVSKCDTAASLIDNEQGHVEARLYIKTHQGSGTVRRSDLGSTSPQSAVVRSTSM